MDTTHPLKHGQEPSDDRTRQITNVVFPPFIMTQQLKRHLGMLKDQGQVNVKRRRICITWILASCSAGTQVDGICQPYLLTCPFSADQCLESHVSIKAITRLWGNGHRSVT